LIEIASTSSAQFWHRAVVLSGWLRHMTHHFHLGRLSHATVACASKGLFSCLSPPVQLGAYRKPVSVQSIGRPCRATHLTCSHPHTSQHLAYHEAAATLVSLLLSAALILAAEEECPPLALEAQSLPREAKAGRVTTLRL